MPSWAPGTEPSKRPVNPGAPVSIPGMPNMPSTAPKAIPGMPDLPGSTPAKKPGGGSQWTASARAIYNLQQSIHKLLESVFSFKNKDVAAQKQQFNTFLSNQYEAPTNDMVVQPGAQRNLDDTLANLKKFYAKDSMHPGVWDIKTQDALKNIYAFASAFVKMSQDFGGIPHGLAFLFKDADVKELASLSQVNTKGMDPNEVADLANHATDIVNKLNNFYNYYYQSIIKNQTYRAHVVENKPLYVLKPSDSDPETILSKTKNLDGLVLKNVTLPAKNEASGRKTVPNLGVAVMQDVNSFQNFLKSSLGYTDEDLAKDPGIMSRTLAAIGLNIQQNSPAITQAKG